MTVALEETVILYKEKHESPTDAIRKCQEAGWPLVGPLEDNEVTDETRSLANSASVTQFI